MDPDDLDAAAADLAALAALWRKRQALIQAIEHEPRENGRASAEKDTQSAGCAVCGQAFTPHRGGPKQRYCGKTCRQRAQSEARPVEARQATIAPMFKMMPPPSLSRVLTPPCRERGTL